MLSFPEHFKIVDGLQPAADAAGRTGRYVNLKNCTMVHVLVTLDQGNAATVALTPYQATAVAGTAEKVLANAVQIWANQDTATSDALVRQTDAVNFTTSAAVKRKQVLFQIDPALLDVEGGFDSITLKTGASNAANITQCTYFLRTRYSQQVPPSAIVD
jgi:hypothetical protein